MNLMFFHLMPYADVDLKEAAKYDSAWVTFPNSNYDPIKGQALYNRYLDETALAEELGYDGVCVNEHHQTSYGLMPSPIVMASILTRITKRVRIAVLGSAIPLRNHPLTLAEEHAMLDVLSGGRLISGFVRGIGSEYHAFGVNPTFSHERFHEAHDLIIRAWRDPGPFPFHGKHYNVNYVNLWPRPIQRPHPPIWIPSQGSKETIDFAAHPDHRYTYLQTFSPVTAVGKFLNMYRETAKQFGYTATDTQLGWAVPVYVAQTDAQALKEAEEHYQNFRHTFLKMPVEMLLPPGYTSRESLKAIALAKSSMREQNSFQANIDMGLVVVGSPTTVRERFTGYWKEFGFGNLLTMMQFGTLPADLTVKSMRLFGAEVLPALQKLGPRGFEQGPPAVAKMREAALAR